MARLLPVFDVAPDFFVRTVLEPPPACGAGAGTRMEADTFAIVRLTPSQRDDYLRFFDHEHGPAFADNPEWAKCYCHYYEVAKALAWASFDADANRTAITARIDVGEMEGFLAYAGDTVVGWINAQPYPKLRHACARLAIDPPELDVPRHAAAAIVCFVVDPAWRRRGVARALLDGALASFAARGIRSVDAFPWKSENSTQPSDHYHGSLPMFLAAGFAVLRDDKAVTVVRKRL
jgi:ribosomal protein S18 acetylase RimI-like enzyme